MQRFLSYENTILAVVMMVSFINPFTSSALTTALPGIGTDYGATDAQLSWVIELFLISSTVTIMPIGKIADRIGKRHVFFFGISVFCISSLAVYFVSSLEGLYVLRLLQGIGSASIFATSMAIVSLVTQPERRGRAMGFTIAAVYCGLSVGPALGGFFSYYLGWKTIFYFIAAVCAAAWVIAAVSMTKEEWIVNANGGLDMPGSFLYAVAMIAVMVGLSEIISLWYAKYMIAVGLVVFLVFLYGEWHKKSPVLPVRIFAGNRVFSFSSLAAMLNYCATFGISFLLSIYLQLSAAHYRPQCPRYGADSPAAAGPDGPPLAFYGFPLGPDQSGDPRFVRHGPDYHRPGLTVRQRFLPVVLAYRPGPNHHRHRLCPLHGAEQ